MKSMLQYRESVPT